MSRKPAKTAAADELTSMYARIQLILLEARSHVARTVNSTQVITNWLIGREIVEEEQHGAKRAGYGEELLASLAEKIRSDGIAGYSLQNLRYMRQFHQAFPALLPAAAIRHAARGELETGTAKEQNPPAAKGDWKWSAMESINQTLRNQPWEPGRLHPNLSWTHYRTLLRVQKPEARAFYEIEATENHWSARELERQINSLLYERLAMSRDKKGLLRLAEKGQEIQTPADIFKDPVVIEFLGLPESPRLVESDLETALLDHLQSFLLELGKGFAFVGRQQRITLDGDHFYIDLVFYHTILKCYVLIDLKTAKLTHQDLGQVQLYVNYYDQQRRTEGDHATLGLILCTDKNEAVVKYTLGADQQQIFASKYQLYLPTEAELKAALKGEGKDLARLRRKKVRKPT